MTKSSLERRLEKLERARSGAGRMVTVWARNEEEFGREVALKRQAGLIRPQDTVTAIGWFEGKPRPEVVELSGMSHEDALDLLE